MKLIISLFLVFQLFSFSAYAQEYQYHVVQSGETVEDIARRYGISEDLIFKYNPDARNGIRPDEKLVVPNSIDQPQEVDFKMHRVKRKETLFSLSQQYNVEIEDIKRFNKHLYAKELRRGERIRIPVNLPESTAKEPEPDTAVNPLNLTAKEHVVLPQETLFGISRRYNVTIEELRRLNPQLENLQPGMVLKVQNGSVDKVIDIEGKLFSYYQVKPRETLFSLTRRFGISKDSLVSLNPALIEGLQSGMVLRIPTPEVWGGTTYDEERIVNLERNISNLKTKNLVIMLPFNLDEIVVTDTSTNAEERLRKDRVMQISLDFYSGALMAIDSAKALGISTKVNFFDTQQSPYKVDSIIRAYNFEDTDAVIGPLLQSTVEAAALGLEDENVPVISPITKKKSGSMQNFLQTVPTDDMLADAMISYISKNAAGKNLVVIADPGATRMKSRLASRFPMAKFVNPHDGSYVKQEDLVAALQKGVPNWVILETDQIGILSNATSALNSMADKYKISIFTTDRNQSFDSDNISNSHLAKLNFHYPSVDRAYPAMQKFSFIRDYREKYGLVPNRYAVRGFDVTYDVLLRLASAENLYQSLEKPGTTQYVENKFDYEKAASGGFHNKAVYILAYDKDLNLKQVW